MKTIHYVIQQDDDWEYIQMLAEEYGLSEQEQMMLHTAIREVELTIIMSEAENFARIIDAASLADNYRGEYKRGE